MINQRSLEIHQRAVACAKQYRNSESDLIDALAEVDSDRTYLKFDKTSLYQYALDYLMLSEDRAVTLISIMRKSKSVPELKQAIREGKITASKANKIVPVLTTENKFAWLELASTSTSRVIEKAVALENPKMATKESLKYKTEDRLELVIGVSKHWEQLLKSVQDIASQKQGRAVSRTESLKLAMECYIEKHDPLQKAERAKNRKDKTLEICESESSTNAKEVHHHLARSETLYVSVEKWRAMR